MATAEQDLTQALWTGDNEAELDIDEAFAHEDEVGDEKRGYIYERSEGEWGKARKRFNWYLRHLREQQQAREEIKEEFDRAIERLRRRRDAVVKEYDDEITRVELVLQSGAEDFRDQILAQTPGQKKTLDLPQGSISFRSQGDAIEYATDEELVSWVEENCDFEQMGELLNVKKSVYKRELKDRLEWIEGVAHFRDENTGELKPLVITVDEGGPEGRNERDVHLVRREHRPEKITIKPVS